ncbi:hypothetical protein L486_04407 [Kwoniella mangroviensis CBS 10435]|uniref:Uncharacterized protein n=1 Tax=Kwoniella mangroviensis CBS 10435 TaxID=1331196 RepID=A0A1B9ISI4_9TREE|nr:hypothetical protein L486_04407 [Kwoniella mangroviensis CBS 10435]OCF78383.1 hypothetical protein I204_00323 [Kwoniella mangroviensis CBS 8886]
MNSTLEDIAKDTYLKKGFGISFGPYIVGFGLDLFLLGFIIHQTCSYANTSKGDRLWSKLAVYWCLSLSMAATGYLFSWMFRLFVYDYGTYTNFYLIDSFSWFVLFDIMTTTVVQVVYLERAWRLNNKSYLLGLPILLIMAASVASGLLMKITSSRLNTVEGESRYWIAIYAWPQLSTVMAADLALTVSIVHGLRKAKTGWQHTDKIITRVMRWVDDCTDYLDCLLIKDCRARMSAEVQLPATLVSTVFVVVISVQSICSIEVICQLIQPKIHVFGLLAMLNSRSSLRNQMSSLQGLSYQDKNSFRLRRTDDTASSRAYANSETALVKSAAEDTERGERGRVKVMENER